jgi:hypothetical protein
VGRLGCEFGFCGYRHTVKSALSKWWGERLSQSPFLGKRVQV